MISARPGRRQLASLFIAVVALGAPAVTGHANTSSSSSSTSAAGPPLLALPKSTAGTECNQTSQLGMDGCAYLASVAADRRLDADVVVIWKLERGYQRTDLARAQKDWVTYRGADCASQTDIYRGGSIMPMVVGYCLAAEDRLRRQDLVTLYNTLTSGAPKQPRLP
ncbi:MAG TPA: lysozyme inhibitor LprI family protein [Acidimicrobiales bacterium]|nr:lysozyme inhibitor LprI family protein [Acidimicrobiales bacterium]